MTDYAGSEMGHVLTGLGLELWGARNGDGERLGGVCVEGYQIAGLLSPSSVPGASGRLAIGSAIHIGQQQQLSGCGKQQPSDMINRLSTGKEGSVSN